MLDVKILIYKKINHLFECIKVKNIYEKIDIDGLKFTTKWVGAYFASVSVDDCAINN